MGKHEYMVQLRADVSKALSDIESLRSQINGVTKGDNKIKIDIDTKSLDEATRNIN